MAGLLSMGQPARDPDMDRDQGTGAPAQDTGMARGMPGGSGFPPEKQAQFEQAFQTGKNIIYDKRLFESIIQTLDKNGPIEMLSQAVVMVLDKIQGDRRLPIDVLMATGIVLMFDLADAISQTGRHQYSQEEIEQALELGTAMYLQMHGGQHDQAELQQQAAAMQQAGGM